MTGELNVFLLSILTCSLLFTIGWKIARRQMGLILGYATGLAYFTIIPLWMLFFTQAFPGEEGTRIPSIGWVDDAPEIFVLIMMLIACVPFILVLRDRQLAPSQPSRTLVLRMLCLYAGLVVVEFMLEGLGVSGSHWAQSKQQFVRDQGLVGLLIILARSTLRSLVLIVLYNSWQNGNRKHLLLLVLFSLVELYTTGNRIVLAQLFILVLLHNLVLQQYKIPLMIAVLAVPLIYSMVIFTVLRTSLHNWQSFSIGGAVDALVTSLDDSSAYYQDRISVCYSIGRVTESNSINIYVAVKRQYPENREFLWGKTLAKPLLFWIPRSVWPNKPHNFTKIAGNELIGEGVSVNSTPMGEPYANFGFFGVIYVPLMLMLMKTLERILYSLKTEQRIVQFGMLVLGFTITRNGLMETGMPMIGTLLLCVIFAPLVAKSDTESEDEGEGSDDE